MDEFYKNRKFCVNVTDGPDEYVKEWVNNKTTDTLIDIFLHELAPQIFFTRYNDNLYEWCGNGLILAEYFSKLTNTRFRKNY